MDAPPTQQADAASPGSNSWKETLGSGLLSIIFATALFWLASRDFRPPPEAPKSLEATLEEAAESSRKNRELLDLLSDRSRVTDGIRRRIKELEAPPVAGDDHAARNDELRRLRQTELAELEKTSELLTANQLEREERKRLAEAPRRKQMAQAAWEWQRKRRVVLAMGLAAAALAGWLVWKAHRLHSEQVLTERAAAVEHRRSASRRAEAGDPQWNQRLIIYLVQLAVCIGCILFGLSESAPPAGVEDEREELLFLGLFGLATSTWWLFFGSIDWSTWNAIKDRMKRLKSPQDDQHPPDPSADG